MPFYPLANASDPRSDAQARRRVKAEKAIRGPRFAVGDAYQVPADEWRGTSLREGFETAMGTGAALTTFYADLDARQLALWNRWFGEYRAQGPGSGEYLNLYDLAFDAARGPRRPPGRRPVLRLLRRALAGRARRSSCAAWIRRQRYQVQRLRPRPVDLGEVTGADPFIAADVRGQPAAAGAPGSVTVIAQ